MAAETSADDAGRRDERLDRARTSVAYILHRFPCLTETFVYREILGLEAQGVHVEIFSLLPPKQTVRNEYVDELIGTAHYSSAFSWKVLTAQLHFLRRSPSRYLRAFRKAVWQTWREPMVLLGVLFLFPKSVRFARRIEDLGIDHIHAHFVWLGGIAAGIVADLLDVTFTIHPHAFGLFARNRTSVRRELENASAIVTISSYHRSYIEELWTRSDPADIHVVHSGLNPDRVCRGDTTRHGGPIRILSIGRLLEKKGFRYLIEACAKLVARGCQFDCRIVGEGPLRQDLQTKIERHGLEDRVRLLGELPSGEVIERLRESDIFALPCVVARSGDRDGLPAVLTEALACELAVVTTPIGGVTDLIEHGESGLLAEPADSGELARHIENLIDDEQLRARLGARGREKVEQQFDSRRNTAKLARIFEDVSRRTESSVPVLSGG